MWGLPRPCLGIKTMPKNPVSLYSAIRSTEVSFSILGYSDSKDAFELYPTIIVLVAPCYFLTECTV